MSYDDMNTQGVLAEIGFRIKRERLNANIKRETLAHDVGVSLIVLSHLENGKGCTLANLVKILRGLNLLHHLDAFIPDPGFSPIQLAKLRGKVRQKASGKS